METLLGTSTTTTNFLHPSLRKSHYLINSRIPCLKVEKISQSFCRTSSANLSISSSTMRNQSVVVRAKRTENDNKNKNKKKTDSHSFVARPDEATGPFPEAILLREKKVQEDGRLLPDFADSDEEELYEYLNLELESELNLERSRHYEVVYLIHEDHDEEVDSINTKIQDFLTEKKGKVWRFSDWGLRRLAYKIKKAKHAHYMLTNFELEAKWINEFKSLLDKDERVIRHLVIKRDEAITEECPPPPEFHTLRADMDEDYDADHDEADEIWDDEDEIDEDGNEHSVEDNIIHVRDYGNDDGDDNKEKHYQRPGLDQVGRRKGKVERVVK